MIGKTLSHYRILDQLGEGGTGVVCRAQDLELKRDVALKILPADMASDSQLLREFSSGLMVVRGLEEW